MRITARPSGKKADARKMAPELLEWCREFYQDPENERAFREWMAGKEAEKRQTRYTQKDSIDKYLKDQKGA